MNRHKKKTILLCGLLTTLNIVACGQVKEGEYDLSIEDLDWVQYESDWEKNETPVQDSAENQNDMKTIFVNRRGDVFSSEGDTREDGDIMMRIALTGNELGAVLWEI